MDDIIKEEEELRTNTDEEPRGFAMYQTPAAQKYSCDRGNNMILIVLSGTVYQF